MNTNVISQSPKLTALRCEQLLAMEIRNRSIGPDSYVAITNSINRGHCLLMRDIDSDVASLRYKCVTGMCDVKSNFLLSSSVM